MYYIKVVEIIRPVIELLICATVITNDHTKSQIK